MIMGQVATPYILPACWAQTRPMGSNAGISKLPLTPLAHVYFMKV